MSLHCWLIQGQIISEMIVETSRESVRDKPSLSVRSCSQQLDLIHRSSLTIVPTEGLFSPIQQFIGYQFFHDTTHFCFNGNVNKQN